MFAVSEWQKKSWREKEYLSEQGALQIQKEWNQGFTRFTHNGNS